MPDSPSSHRKNDRVIVLLSILVGGGLAAYVITQALGFRDQFRAADDFAAGDSAKRITGVANIADNTAKLQGRVSGASQPRWSAHRASGRERGFLVSTNLVFQRDGASEVIVDLDKEEPMLRPPLPNAWLVSHRLPLEFSNVGELDTDEDFFSNLEEFEFGKRMGVEFDPNDPESRPPLHFRLTFSRTSVAPYQLTYTSGQGEQFFFRRGDEDRANRWSALATLNEPFGGRRVDQDRFKVIEASTIEEQAEGADFNIKKGIVKVEDSSRPPGHPLRVFEIKEGDTIDLPVIEAVFDFPATPGKPIIVREFERFSLPGAGGSEYTLMSVDEREAVLAFGAEGEQSTLRIPQGGRAEP